MNNFKKYHCETCDTFYCDQRALTRHYKTKKHLGKGNKHYQCETCDYETYDPANWKRHTLTKKHLNGGSLTDGKRCTQCQLCLKEFKNNDSYRSHMSSHNMSKVAFVSKLGRLTGQRTRMRRELAYAEHIIRKKSYQRVDDDKLADARDIVDTYEEKIDALTDEIQRYMDHYNTKLKDVPVHSEPSIRELETKLRDAQRVVDEFDKRMEKKGKQLKQMSKKDRMIYTRNETIIKVTKMKLKTLRK